MIRYLLPIILTVSSAVAQSPEIFDTSGMPRRPTVFVEQQIFDLIHWHKYGDLSDAARIQRKLGNYYLGRHDQTRAQAAFLSAAQAEAMTAATSTPTGAVKTEIASNIEPYHSGRSDAIPDHSAGSRLTGNYFGFDGRTLHTWEFHADGSFLHTWMASGSGTSVRSSERGRFRLLGDRLQIQVTSLANGFNTPGVGGQSTLVGGGAEAANQVRDLTFHWTTVGQSMVLDGIALKLKPW